MMVYIGNTGHISIFKKSKKLKILFWSRESKKQIFTIFPNFFTKKIQNTGISSETTIPGISSETAAPVSWLPTFRFARCQIWLQAGRPVPGFPSSHPRFPGFRRLTRDSRNRRLTRDSRIPDFSRKNFRKNRFFGLPGPK